MFFICNKHYNPPKNNVNIITQPDLPTSPENVTGNFNPTNPNTYILGDPYFKFIEYYYYPLI